MRQVATAIPTCHLQGLSRLNTPREPVIGKRQRGLPRWLVLATGKTSSRMPTVTSADGVAHDELPSWQGHPGNPDRVDRSPRPCACLALRRFDDAVGQLESEGLGERKGVQLADGFGTAAAPYPVLDALEE